MRSKNHHPSVISKAKSIDVVQLPWVLYINKKQLPLHGGIYFVGTDEEPTTYIGYAMCFKSRFVGHHRSDSFEQLIKEHGQENVKIRFWQAPPMPKHELQSFLLQVEDFLISNLKTRFNYTANTIPKTPRVSVRRTCLKPIYVQINQLGEYYVEDTGEGTAGFYFSLNKFSMAENAIKYRSPAFLISSGSWEEALIEYGTIQPEWKQYATLYFLEARFRARWIEEVGRGGIEEFVLSGDQATFHQIFLNELPGFKEFSIKHLRTGLTNCSSSDFCETLLDLTRKRA